MNCMGCLCCHCLLKLGCWLMWPRLLNCSFITWQLVASSPAEWDQSCTIQSINPASLYSAAPTPPRSTLRGWWDLGLPIFFPGLRACWSLLFLWSRTLSPVAVLGGIFIKTPFCCLWSFHSYSNTILILGHLTQDWNFWIFSYFRQHRFSAVNASEVR